MEISVNNMTIPPMNKMALKGLIYFSINYAQMNENLCVQIIKLINLSVQRSVSILYNLYKN